MHSLFVHGSKSLYTWWSKGGPVRAACRPDADAMPLEEDDGVVANDDGDDAGDALRDTPPPAPPSPEYPHE
jgi:hypothetical protein